MVRDKQEAIQAGYLDTVVENIIAGDRDLFENARTKSVLPSTLELIDLATFILPPSDVSDAGFVGRMENVALKEIRERLVESDAGSVSHPRSLSMLQPVIDLWSTVTAFLAALVMEPASRSGTGLVDSPHQSWYKYSLERSAADLVYSDAPNATATVILRGHCAYKTAICR